MNFPTISAEMVDAAPKLRTGAMDIAATPVKVQQFEAEPKKEMPIVTLARLAPLICKVVDYEWGTPTLNRRFSKWLFVENNFDAEVTKALLKLHVAHMKQFGFETITDFTR
jgi:hypothetical protein